MNPVRITAVACVFCGVVWAQQAPTISGCPTFPANNVWNAPIDALPLDAHSPDYLSNIGLTSTLRYDITIPINIVPGTQPKVPLNINYPDESDPGPYPIPPDAQVEQGSDAHVIVVDKDNCILYETFYSTLQPDGSWTVDSSAKWSLLSNALRPAEWTSADAAGLPMMPGILRYEEVLAGQVNHALRFTAPRTQRLFVWPGRHYASYNTSPALPPMGQRFRLKASFDISGFAPNVQTILRAMKKYGIILADNGLPWEMQLAVDSRWNVVELDQLRSIAGSNLEAVDESSLMVNADSGQAGQQNTVTVTVTPAAKTLSASQSQQFTATVSGSTLGVVWSMTPSAGTLSSAGLYTAPAVVSSSQNVTVTATLTDGSKSGSGVVTLQAAPVALASVAVSPTSVVGPNNVSVTVTLTGAAPSGGAAVALTGSNAAFPAANVTVAAGSIFQSFSLATSVVAAATPVTVTASYNGSSVLSSVLTVNPAAPPSTGAAAFVKTDSTTGGWWKAAYGAEGYNIINDSVNYPAYVAATPAGTLSWTWAASTSDPRAPQKGVVAGDRIAACWYTQGAFSVDLNFSDGKTHQVAFYMLDWDNFNGGRNQKVDVLDGNNTVLDTRTVAGFAGGQYVVWNLSGHVIVRVTNQNAASNAVLSGIFFGAGVTVPASGTAAFVKTDGTTAGTWKGVYGADGYNVINDSATYPAYVTVTPSGTFPWTWAGSTSDVRAPQKGAAAADRIAACWYSQSPFTIDVKFNDANSHQVALYMLDWDNFNGGRSQRVEILDVNSNTLLDSRTATGFRGGQYLVWNLSGHVMVRITNLNPSSTSALSGLFFGAGSPPGMGTAAFVKSDTTTAGSWKGAYGGDGFNVINDTANYPSYVTVTPSGNSPWTWAASTSDARAPQKFSSAADRIAACWYSLSTFTIDLKFGDANTHQVALYMLDWDNYYGRNQRVEILDGNNTVLDTRTVTGFTGGQYVVWNLSGHVIVRITNLNGASTSALSGIFFGPGAAAAGGTATFLKTDTTTAGTWKGVYGADGYNVIGDTANYPAYVTAMSSGNLPWTWLASTSDVRAPQKGASATDRLAACWYTQGGFAIDLKFSDANTHQLALYLLDWDNFNGRNQRVDILDANYKVLDTRAVTNFVGGQYLVWNVSGHVIVQITNLSAPSNAVLSGIFFR